MSRRPRCPRNNFTLTCFITSTKKGNKHLVPKSHTMYLLCRKNRIHSVVGRPPKLGFGVLGFDSPCIHFPKSHSMDTKLFTLIIYFCSTMDMQTPICREMTTTGISILFQLMKKEQQSGQANFLFLCNITPSCFSLNSL
jgi:hypothetical protein